MIAANRAEIFRYTRARERQLHMSRMSRTATRQGERRGYRRSGPDLWVPIRFIATAISQSSYDSGIPPPNRALA
jgi:hypothetical protein